MTVFRVSSWRKFVNPRLRLITRNNCWQPNIEYPKLKCSICSYLLGQICLILKSKIWPNHGPKFFFLGVLFHAKSTFTIKAWWKANQNVSIFIETQFNYLNFSEIHSFLPWFIFSFHSENTEIQRMWREPGNINKAKTGAINTAKSVKKQSELEDLAIINVTYTFTATCSPESTFFAKHTDPYVPVIWLRVEYSIDINDPNRSQYTSIRLYRKIALPLSQRKEGT